jgi:hypothetical protein
MSRIFEHPNMDHFRCPICGGSDDMQVVLVAIVGTEEGSIVQAEQTHLDCLLGGVSLYREGNMIVCPLARR